MCLYSRNPPARPTLANDLARSVCSHLLERIAHQNPIVDPHGACSKRRPAQSSLVLLDAISGQLLFVDAQDRLDDLAAARVRESLINVLQLVEANE
jgi:hypothetical protein